MKLTERQREGLDMLAETGRLCVSNKTDVERRHLYWQTAHALCDKGCAALSMTAAGEFIEITNIGRQEALR